MNRLIYGDIDTADYHIGISGGGTYAAPERDVTRYEIPGRNGDLVVDNGRYKNIEVTYPSFIARRFKAEVENFRSALMRKRGYQKIEDTYHPDEYRMGYFAGMFEPETVGAYNNSARFDLRFSCKPQRFLKSGDTPIQLLTPIYMVGVYSTQYIPHVAGETISVTAVCPEGETLTLTLSCYDANDTSASIQRKEKTIVNGQTVIFTQPTLSVDSAYWKLFVDGYSNYKAIKFRVKTNTIYDGKPLAIDAWMTTELELTNPTGYATYPLFEVYGSIFPSVNLTNYSGDERTSWFMFLSSYTSGAKRLNLDCDLQYLYTDTGSNATKNLILSNMGSVGGEGFVFPVFGDDRIVITEMNYRYADKSYGLGLVNIYPRWWKL